MSILCETTKQTDVDWYNSCEKLAPGDNIKFDDQSITVAGYCGTSIMVCVHWCTSITLGGHCGTSITVAVYYGTNLTVAGHCSNSIKVALHSGTNLTVLKGRCKKHSNKRIFNYKVPHTRAPARY